MITITQIIEQINRKKNMQELNPEEGREMNWKPKECTDYMVPPFEIPGKRSKKCTRDKLSKVLAFIDLVKYKRLAHGCTIMPIACTNKRLTEICGSTRNASNLISYMIKIGLLGTESEKYQFRARNEKYNQSKVYRYYYENEENIIGYCENNGIEKYKTKNYEYIHTVVEKFDDDDLDEDQVRFNSNLRLKKPDKLSVAEFENYLTQALHRNYPELAHYQRMADYINETYYADDPQRQIHFTPNFTWTKNKYIRKIGIRATNTFVSAKKEPGNNEAFKGYYRSQVLERYGMNLEKDVSSSVPRITLSLNEGRWIPEDIDIYKKIYEEYIKRKIENEGTSFLAVMPPFDKVRTAIKELHMRGYFVGENTIGNHTRRVMAEVKDKNEVDDEMRLLQKAVTAAEGGHLYGSEIFYHESCIYMEVLGDLLGEGYNVWQCYDAWYTAKEGMTQEEFESHATRLVAKRADEYIKRNINRTEKVMNKRSAA